MVISCSLEQLKLGNETAVILSPGAAARSTAAKESKYPSAARDYQECTMAFSHCAGENPLIHCRGNWLAGVFGLRCRRFATATAVRMTEVLAD